jgi:hypothetical protein
VSTIKKANGGCHQFLIANLDAIRRTILPRSQKVKDMAILRDAPRRRSQRVSLKKRGRLVVNLASNQKLLPCIVVDSSKEGFRLRASLRVRRGDLVEVILDEPQSVIEQCSVVWIGKPDTKEFGEVGLEIVRPTAPQQHGAYN